MDEMTEATAPAEQSPVAEPQVEETTQEAPTNEPEQPKRSRREALEQAFKDVDKAEGEDKPEAKVGDQKPVGKASETPKTPTETPKPQSEAKTDGPERGPDGKFVAKDKPEEAKPAAEPQGKLTDPPSRFSEEAKKAWAEAPETVRAETYRAIRETEQGIQKYQEAIEPIKPFLQMAKGDPRALASAMGRYVNTENMLRENPVAGFTEIARNMGLSPQQVGKMLMGEDPGQGDPRDNEINTLRSQLQQLQAGYGQINQSMTQQRQQAVTSQVEQFAADHPRFDELSDSIAQMLQTGFASDLQDAYEKADRLNPAPAPEPEPAPPATPAQTRQSLSVTGAPTSGSNPATRKPSANRKEALQNAMRRAGF